RLENPRFPDPAPLPLHPRRAGASCGKLRLMPPPAPDKGFQHRCFAPGQSVLIYPELLLTWFSPVFDKSPHPSRFALRINISNTLKCQMGSGTEDVKKAGLNCSPPSL